MKNIIEVITFLLASDERVKTGNDEIVSADSVRPDGTFAAR